MFLFKKKKKNSPPSLAAIESCTVEWTRSPPEAPQLRKLVLWPLFFFKRLYNTYLLMRYRELREPVARNSCPLRWLTSFPTLFFTARLTSIPAMIKSIMKHPRKDPKEGLFDDRENAKAMLPILRDLYPSETVTADDFLLCCHKEFVNQYRQPILQFIGPQNIKKHGDELEKVTHESLAFMLHKSQGGRVNASEFSHVFATTVISRLLLGHPGPFEVYCQITDAMDYLNKYAIMRAWRQPISKEEREKYTQSIETVRAAIDQAMASTEKPILGSLVDSLRQDPKMTTLQMKTTLFLMYFAGSETSASLLTYLLWQLGRHPEYQEKIYQELQELQGTLFEKSERSQTIEKLFDESIRLFSPSYVMGRQLAADLTCVVKDREGKELFRNNIAKEEGFFCASTCAGRDPFLYENPDFFNPDRFQTPLKTMPWLPFGDGKHACPGQWLAKAEVAICVACLVERYRLQSSPEKEPSQKGYMTLKCAEDVWLTLTPRQL